MLVSDSYHSAIRSRITSMAIGTVFSISDVEDCGSYDAVRKSLSRLADGGLIQRVLIGVYWFMPGQNITSDIHPSIEDVAFALARNNDWIIMPGTELCRYHLGLRKDPPEVPDYLISGPSKSYVYGGTVRFRTQKCPGKILTFLSAKSAVVVAALLNLSEHPVSAADIIHLSDTLDLETKQLLLQERKYIPARIRNVIEIICGTYGVVPRGRSSF